jgi:hypothetical protein
MQIDSGAEVPQQGHQEGGLTLAAGRPKIMTAVVTTKTMKPYIVNRCEMRRSGFSNSLEASTSFARVLTASPIFSPPLTSRLAIFFSDWPFSKKYFPLFLCDVEQGAADDQKDHQDDVGLHDPGVERQVRRTDKVCERVTCDHWMH